MKISAQNFGFWRFGVVLARLFRFPAKLQMIFVFLGLPLLAMTFFALQINGRNLVSAGTQIEGGGLVLQASRVSSLIQKYRAQASALSAGGTSTLRDLQQTRAELDLAISGMLAATKSTRQLQLTKPWQLVAERLHQLPTGPQNANTAAYIKILDDFSLDLRYFNRTVVNQSTLLSETDAATQLLVNTSALSSLTWAAQIAQTSQAVSSVLNKPATDAASDIERALTLYGLAQLVADIRFDMGSFQQASLRTEGLRAALDSSVRFQELSSLLIAGEPGRGRNSAAYFAASLLALEGVSAAQSKMAEQVVERSKERLNYLVWQRNLLLLAILIEIAVIPYILVSFYKSLMFDIRRVGHAMEKIISGDLRISCEITANDEINDLVKLLQRMVESVSGIVAAVGSEAALVADIGHNFGARNRELSNRTEQQAANLRQTAASVHDLVSTVQQNAVVSNDVNKQAVSVRDIAETGAHAMETSIKYVEEIQKNSRRMHEIISVIDGLAFQTNILALNAAVESARAGAQGRGFAVVASEVRSLAQRSAENAHAIRHLIESSSSQVESSMKQIRSAGEGMSRIVIGVREVSSSIAQISAASEEQSIAISEISKALEELDNITHENQIMVERTVVQSEGLQKKAGSLAESISHVKMNQGLAGEAVALVNRAVEFRQQCSSNDIFFQGLTDNSNQFFDRDMYVFILDPTGTYRAFGGNPAKVGTRVQDIPGVDGQGLLDAILNQAAIEPGWVEYKITNPSNGKVQIKMSYVHAVNSNMAVGCGVYKNLVTS